LSGRSHLAETVFNLALVGIGKIARDQHLPAISADPSFRLVATASRNARVDGVPGYRSVGEALKAHPEIDVVSLATPPQPRYEQALAAIAAGKSVMLEKPPGVRAGDVETLAALADAAGVSLFASWHAREASGVSAAKSWLAGRTIEAVSVNWLEDIRVWHPGQDWVLERAGLGVFDPGINALSILTEILPFPLELKAAKLAVPSNREAPVRAELALDASCPVTAVFDFLHPGEPAWKIDVKTTGGTLRLEAGGERLLIDGAPHALPAADEYGRLYRRFAALVASGESDLDVRPLTLVLEALSQGTTMEAPAFYWSDEGL